MSGSPPIRAPRWPLLLLLSASLLCVLWARPAIADSREEEARKAYEAGFEASEASNFELALEHYEHSYSVLPRPRTMYNIALCEDRLGRGEEAIDHFEEFLRIATDREADYRGTAIARLSELKKKFYGTLVVKSQPSRAQVFIDGGARGEGKTPLEIILPPGVHELTVVSSRNRPAVRNVEVFAAKRTTEFVSLGKAALDLVITPENAKVERMDKPGVEQERLIHSMEPGTYRFRVSAPGYESRTLEVRLEADVKLERHVDLEVLASSKLRIESFRAGATVTVDGRVLGLTQHGSNGKTASIETALNPGEHTVIIELGKTTVHRRVHTAEREQLTLSLDANSGAGARSKPLVWGLAGLGATSLLVGGGLGLHSLVRGSRDDPEEHEAARSQALVGDLLVLGGAGALLGAWALKGSDSAQLAESRSTLKREVGVNDAR